MDGADLILWRGAGTLSHLGLWMVTASNPKAGMNDKWTFDGHGLSEPLKLAGWENDENGQISAARHVIGPEA